MRKVTVNMVFFEQQLQTWALLFKTSLAKRIVKTFIIEYEMHANMFC